jgi:DNA invertase Pin-like site-specific DNA recombinase
MGKQQLKAVGYARISKDDTLEGRGVARQTEDITAVCERNGWTLDEVLTDNDISASRYSRKARPRFRQLLELIEAGAVDRAVVYDVDRLLRQPRELEDLIDLCEKRNGAFQLHNVNGEMDLITSSGRFVARMLVAKAAMESDDLSRRLRRASDQRAAAGRPHGARAFGYEPDGMTIRDSEAALIRQAAADVLAGTSLNTIARRWNELGVLTPQRSKQWNGTIVKAVLTNPRHAGLRVHRREVVGPAAWPAVIDRTTHDRLVAFLTIPKPRQAPRRRAFTGLIRSAKTGLPLQRDVVRGYVMYRGHNNPGREAGHVTIAAEALETLILEALFTAVEDDTLAAIIGEQRARRAAAPDLRSLEADLRALAEDHGHGRISRAEWMAARVPLEERLTAAQALVVATEQSAALAVVDVNLRRKWPNLPVDTQRAILGAVFEAVLIHPARGDHQTPEGEQCGRCARRPGRRGGPAPTVEGIGRIDLTRVEVRWRV